MLSAKGTGQGRLGCDLGKRPRTSRVPAAEDVAPAEVAAVAHEFFWTSSSDGLFSLKVGGGRFSFASVNPAYRRLNGLRGLDLADARPSDCLPADVARMLLVRCRDCVATGKPVEYDDDDGSTGKCRRTILTPMKDPITGRVTSIMGKLQELAGPHGTPKPDVKDKRLLERIIDTSPDIIYVVDIVTGRSDVLSRRVEKELGYSRKFLQKRRVRELVQLVHPNDQANFRAHLRAVRALTDGAVGTVELRFCARDGSYRWFRLKETVFSRTADGSVKKVLGILSDIDRLKKARIAFTETNAKLVAILTSISDSYLTIDHQCRVTDLNAAAAKWLGVDSVDVIGKNYRNILAGSVAEDAVKKAIRRRQRMHTELTSQLHPGQWVDLRVYPSETGVNIFFSDITQRKQAEASAARSKALLNASIDSLSAHIVILDAAGTIVASNKAWRRFAARQWPKTSKTWHGVNLLALYARTSKKLAHSASIVAGLRALLAGRRTTMRHIYYLGSGNGGHWYQFIAARFLHEGRAFAALATEDVTDVRAARKALGELSERMLTLQEDERQRIAVELHDSTAQHLAAIGLNAMSLKVRSASDHSTRKLWEDVEHSLEEATRELRALTYLLHPTRLERDGLNAALRRYAEGFAARTGLTVTLKLNQGADGLPISVRRSMLRIVQEALANVHRHALASRVSVRQKLAGNKLHLVVSDNGRVVRRLAPSGGSKKPPLGVGIPEMRERLRRWGGNLEVRTGPRGTTVDVIVPLAGTSEK